jgi:hypothetical protein
MGDSSSRWPEVRVGRAVEALVLSAVLAVAGCASVRVEPGGETARAPRPVASVQVLDAVPAAPYRSIARIEVRDRGLGREARDLRTKLVSEAARLGADAVVFEEPSTRRSVGLTPHPIGLYDELVVAGTAIVFGTPADDAAPSPPAPGPAARLQLPR